ncbi:MAG: polysaccharide deacetylase family protein [Pseudonocardia sp.]
MTTVPTTTALKTSVPILMYHSIGSSTSAAFRRFAVDPGLFAEHLAHLRDAGHNALTVSELVAHRAAGTALPPRPVVLTFDDGFADFHDVALPALARHALTATLYVVTGYLGGTSGWLVAEGEGERPILSRSQVVEVAAAGVEIGAHTRTHPQLDNLATRGVAVELAGPKAELEELLGRSVDSFAYPFGYHSRAVRAAVARAGYRSACAVRDRVSTAGEDAFGLSRLTVDAGTDVAGLQRLLRTGPAGAGERLVHETKRLIWQAARRHGPAAVTGATASGVPLPAGRRPR